MNLAVLFVTHDLSVVAAHADAVHVLYAGRVRGMGAGGRIFSCSPGTRIVSAALLGAVGGGGKACRIFQAVAGAGGAAAGMPVCAAL